MEDNISKFCPCNDRACPLHPLNHNEGCSLCIAKNIRKREIPSCFFNAQNGYPSKNGYSFEAFAELVLSNKKEN